MLATVLYAAVFVAVVYPDTATGKAIRNVLVAITNRIGSHLTWARVLFAVAVICAVVAAIDVIGRDGIQMFAAAAPEVIAWFVAFDIATYIDVMALAWALAALVRVRTLAQTARSSWTKIKRRLVRQFARARRSTRQHTRRTPRKQPPKPGKDKSPDSRQTWSTTQPVFSYA